MRLKKYIILTTTFVFTDVENKIPDHTKYTTTPEFTKLTA